MVGLAAAQKNEAFEVWPENWKAFSLFLKMQTQWRVSTNGRTGMDYTALLALMDRMHLSDAEHDELFDSMRAMEQAALEAMH